jgi:predicted Zn finger-like uncharacterized protein
LVEIRSMHIVCPHCTTSYAIDLATLGVAGRNVRCSRCKEVWLARPEEAIAAPAMAVAGRQDADADAAAEWEAMARQDDGADAPVVDSPSISADWPAEGEASKAEDDWTTLVRDETHAERSTRKPCRKAGPGSAGFPHRRQRTRANRPSASPPPAPRWARWCWR